MAVELGMATVIIRREALRRVGVEEEWLAKAADSKICCFDDHLLAMDTMGETNHLIDPLLALGLVDGEDIAATKSGWCETGSMGQGGHSIRYARLRGSDLAEVVEMEINKVFRDRNPIPRPWGLV